MASKAELEKEIQELKERIFELEEKVTNLEFNARVLTKPIPQYNPVYPHPYQPYNPWPWWEVNRITC